MNTLETPIIEKFGEPALTNHPHIPMTWTLADIKRLFPTRRFDKVTLVGRNKEIMRGE